MRIDETDLQKAVVKRLKDSGFNVIADDVKEGFDRPAIFVGTYPTSITRLCGGLERVTDSVSMVYYPRVETRLQCMQTANKLRTLFVYRTLDVADRRFTVEELTNDIDETNVLTSEFELTYEQPLPNAEEYEDMEILYIGGIDNGTTVD